MTKSGNHSLKLNFHPHSQKHTLRGSRPHGVIHSIGKIKFKIGEMQTGPDTKLKTLPAAYRQSGSDGPLAVALNYLDPDSFREANCEMNGTAM